MKKYGLLLIVVCLFAFACNRVKETTKDVVGKTAETAGKVGGDLADKVTEGVKKSMKSTTELSKALQDAGITLGKIDYRSSANATDNILSAYFIFTKAFDKTIQVKVFDEAGLEYGRSSLRVKSAKDTAKYIDFVFDDRVNLASKSKFIFE